MLENLNIKKLLKALDLKKVLKTVCSLGGTGKQTGRFYRGEHFENCDVLNHVFDI